jgi:hypothetical protein
MIVKMNGTLLNPVMDWVNGKADSFIQWEAETAANGAIWAIGGVLKTMSPIIPELAVFAICVLITIGMFTDFSKWLARSLLVFMGAVVWIMLSKI